MKILDGKKSLWGIEAYGVWGEERGSYGRYRNVLAFTLEDAIEKIKGANPGIKIVSVNHKGQVDLE